MMPSTVRQMRIMIFFCRFVPIRDIQIQDDECTRVRIVGGNGGVRVYDKVKVQNKCLLVRLDIFVAQEEVEGQIEEWVKIVANSKNKQSTIYF